MKAAVNQVLARSPCTYGASRTVFLRFLAVIYLFAFSSFYIQVPGLFSEDGVMRTKADFTEGLNKLSLLGMGLSVVAAGLGITNVFMMAALVMLYGSLVTGLPGPFYNFQWDILLLEAGVAAMWWAPVCSSKVEPYTCAAPRWLLRFTLFKLMLMSGVVKLTEGDHTWKDLTAIWYHFATQCIPTPLAWYFHNLPMSLEKLFCAICFAIEIPGAFLILLPGPREVCCLAALLQVMLQVVIILTGNFTFFNLLTICLALPLLDDGIFVALGCFLTPSSTTEAEDEEAREPLLQSSAQAESPVAKYERAFHEMLDPYSSFMSHIAVLVAFCVFLTASVPFGLFTLRLTVTASMVMGTMTWLLPNVMLCMVVLFCCIAVLDVAKAATTLSTGGWQGKLLAGLAAGAAVFRGWASMRCMLLSAEPLSEIAPGLESWTAYAPRKPLSHVPDHTYGYGLFRAMTGVGPHGQVARPEISIEVQEEGSGVWKELQFRYKPGKIGRAPPIIAPYQPRLDWQMWFQALMGVDETEIWFEHLLGAILTARPAALQLLDADSLPHQSIKAVRAQLYTYNFTSWSATNWWQRTPVGEASSFTTRGAPKNLAAAAASYGHGWRGTLSWGCFAAVFFVPVCRVASGLLRNWGSEGSQSRWERMLLFLAICLWVCVLLILSGFLRRRFADLIAIWALCLTRVLTECATMCMEPLAKRVGGRVASRATNWAAAVLETYATSVPCIIAACFAQVALQFNMYTCWLVFSVLATMIAAQGCWGLAKAASGAADMCLAPITEAGCLAALGLVPVIFFGNAHWAS